MEYKTSDLPGIGKRHSYITSKGEQIVVITHVHGHRELYHFADPDDDEPDFALHLSDEEARQLGAIFLGVDYQPVSDDRMQIILEGIRMEWVPIKPSSCLVDSSIADSQIRKRTGATIIGIKRGKDIVGSPGADEVLRSGDLLLVIGGKDPVNSLRNLCLPR